MNLRKHLRNLTVMTAIAVMTSSCESIDDQRIPPANVNIVFRTIGDWQIYGISGAGQYKQFIRSEKQPAGYPYGMSEYTGFGGLLLTCDPNGEYLVYDLACPVEVKPTVRVEIDSENPLAGVARCNKCGSTYNLFGYGAPLSGEALSAKYGLQKYHIAVGTASTPYAIITR